MDNKVKELLDQLQVALFEEMKIQLQENPGEVKANVLKEIRELLKQHGMELGENKKPATDLLGLLPFPDEEGTKSTTKGVVPKTASG